MIRKIKNWFNNKDKITLIILSITFLFLIISSMFRFADDDEKLYLHETMMMAEILKKGEWIGNYGVGVHGFLFKLPVALIYLITGPSIFVATLSNIVLAILSGWIFYKILAQNLNSKFWANIGLLIFITNFGFINWSLTFHREIPVVFTVLLFIKCLLDKKNKFILGFILLLILDAKEYIFFIITPPYILYLIIQNLNFKYKLFSFLKNTIVDFLKSFIFPLIYLLLMFFTSIIPLNMVNATFLGLNTSGFSYQLRHTTPKTALSDLSTYKNTNYIYNKIIETTPTITISTIMITPTPTEIKIDKDIKIQVLNATNIKGQAATFKTKLIALDFENVTIGNISKEATESSVQAKSATVSAYFQKKLSDFPATFSSNLENTSNFDVIFIIGTKLNLVPNATQSATPIINPTIPN